MYIGRPSSLFFCSFIYPIFRRYPIYFKFCYYHWGKYYIEILWTWTWIRIKAFNGDDIVVTNHIHHNPHLYLFRSRLGWFPPPSFLSIYFSNFDIYLLEVRWIYYIDKETFILVIYAIATNETFIIYFINN